MTFNKFCTISTHVIAFLVFANFTFAAGIRSPTSVGPYPLNAAGWGPEVNNGLEVNGFMMSRWAEDWTAMRQLNHAPLFKAMPLGDEASLTLSSEIRLRYDAYDNGQLKTGNDYQQGFFRGILGADLHVNPNLRVYGEIATGQVDGRRNEAPANFQNDASLQQLFVDVRDYFGSTLVGAMVGRQEYADGPRQLISLGDGPNIHRTWNGVRTYFHRQHFRVGLFDLRATQLKQGVFDEVINNGEHIQGISISQIKSADDSPNIYWDSFWTRSEKQNFLYGGNTAIDDRDTLGNRLWGSKGDFSFDITLAHQTGEYNNRDIDSWGFFAVNSYPLSNEGWKPKLTAHIDIASGGGAYDRGTIRGFNPLYASSNYLGEGQALSLSNLLMIAPGFSVTPTKQISLSIEYGFAQRLKDDDAVYAGGMRAYTSTQNVTGYEIGGLLRFVGTWSASENLILSLNYEHLDTGDVLKHAKLPSSSYANVGATFRY
jgi:hypothetical protein